MAMLDHGSMEMDTYFKWMTIKWIHTSNGNGHIL
jgi:hypothetical protein